MTIRTRTLLSDRLINDSRLSFEARGMMAYLLNKQANKAPISITGLLAESPCGREKTQKILRELEKFHLIVRWRDNKINGQSCWGFRVFQSEESGLRWKNSVLECIQSRANERCSIKTGYRKHQAFVFERDGFKCVYCGSNENLTLDHKIPQSRGGGHDPENLCACCSTCNSRKGARTPKEWLGVIS